MPTSDRSMNPTMQTSATCYLTSSARLQKRTMYGRAGFSLLRSRVLHAA
jgi:hypothetical protein